MTPPPPAPMVAPLLGRGVYNPNVSSDGLRVFISVSASCVIWVIYFRSGADIIYHQINKKKVNADR